MVAVQFAAPVRKKSRLFLNQSGVSCMTMWKRPVSRTMFDEFVSQEYRRTFQFVRRNIPDNAAAEEVTQEVLVGLWKTASKESQIPILNVEGLLKDIVKKRCFSWHQGPGKIRYKNSTLGDLENDLDYSQLIQKYGRLIPGAEGHLTNLTIAKCIEQLRPLDKAMVMLCYFYERSYEEAASELAIETYQVKHRLPRARQQVRRCMNDR
jgi:RNA polymerase sigma-70 factor, ECF subfamily